MNFLRLVSKNYFDPFVLTTCGLVNSAMFYYKYNIDGIVVTNHVYKNHANNKEYEKSQKSNTKLSCMCGKLQ